MTLSGPDETFLEALNAIDDSIEELQIASFTPALPGELVYEYAKDQTTGLVVNVNGDYSVTPERFIYTAPPGEVVSIGRMIGMITDTGVMVADDYGSLGSPLTNGVTVAVRDGADALVVDLTGGQPVKTNVHWAQICYDMSLMDWGTGIPDESLAFRWSFYKSGAPVLLDGDLGEYISVEVSDDLSGLIEHRFLFQGYIL